MDASWNYAVIHQRGLIYSNEISTATIQRTSFNTHPLTLTLNAESTFKIGPALVASASLTLWNVGANADADVYLYSDLTGQLKVPAMDALTSATTPSTILGTLGDCTVPHYVQFDWELIADGTFSALLLSKNFGPYNAELVHEDMLIGCVVSASTVEEAKSFAMSIANTVVDTAAALASLLQEEFASYLNTDSTNIYVQLDDANPGAFQVMILNGDSNLQSSLCSALMDSSNSIYSSTYATVSSIVGQVTVSCS